MSFRFRERLRIRERGSGERYNPAKDRTRQKGVGGAQEQRP